MTSSVLSVELVNVAYERMKDCPAHWSVLIRTPVMVTRVELPLNDFLSMATDVTVPGFRYTLPCKLRPKPPVALPVNGIAMPGVKLAPGVSRSPGRGDGPAPSGGRGVVASATGCTAGSGGAGGSAMATGAAAPTGTAKHRTAARVAKRVDMFDSTPLVGDPSDLNDLSPGASNGRVSGR